MSVELTVGEYRSTADFIKIRMHVAVMEVGTNKLIAITGPQGDYESEAYAKLFAAAPELLAAAIEALHEGRIHGHLHTTANKLADAIAKAEGRE